MDILNDALIGHFVSSVISLFFSSICKLFRKLAERKVAQADDAIISHFQQNITSDQGVLSEEAYQEIKRQMARKYNVRPSRLLTKEQLQCKLTSKLVSSPHLSANQKVDIFQRILDVVSNRQGSATIEAVTVILLVLLSILGAFELFKQITTHTFVFSAAKVAGLLISSILFFVIAKKKH